MAKKINNSNDLLKAINEVKDCLFQAIKCDQLFACIANSESDFEDPNFDPSDADISEIMKVAEYIAAKASLIGCFDQVDDYISEL